MSHERAARRIGAITESSLFRRLVTLLILLNAIIVGLETYPGIRAVYGPILSFADRVILYLFVGELILRFSAAPTARAFFGSGWNVFDLIIVAAGFSPHRNSSRWHAYLHSPRSPRG